MEDRKKKRDSIFSNGSINGFNSALFLASEFTTDSDSETWIPINDQMSSNSNICNKKIKSGGLNIKRNSCQIENEFFQQNIFSDIFKDDKIVSEESSPLKKEQNTSNNNISKNKSNEGKIGHTITNNNFFNQRRFSTPVNMPGTDPSMSLKIEKNDSRFFGNVEKQTSLNSINLFNMNSNQNINPQNNNYQMDSSNLNPLILSNNSQTNMNMNIHPNIGISNSNYNVQSYSPFNSSSQIPNTGIPPLLNLNQNTNIYCSPQKKIKMQIPHFQQPITMNTMVYHNLLMNGQNPKTCFSSNDKQQLKSASKPIKKEKIKEKQDSQEIIDDSILGSKNNCKKKEKNKKKQIIREGDWVCSECQNLNFSFRNNCNKCAFIRVDAESTPN